MPHDVFISYSSIDKAAAFAACATFEAAAIRCWIAPRDVAAGAEWAEEIIDAIERAKIMVLIFSSNSNESRQVKREIELAVSRGLTIMPLRLEQIEPTRSMAYYMAGVHWIDALTPPLETHFKKMVEWIKPHLEDGPSPESSRTTAPSRSGAQPGETPHRADAPREAPAKKRGLLETLLGIKPPPAPLAGPIPSMAEQIATDRMSVLERVFGTETLAAIRSGKDRPPLPVDEMSRMFRAALDLQRQNAHRDAIAAYGALLGRIYSDTRAVAVEETVRALFNTGNSLTSLSDTRLAIAMFDLALEQARGRDEEGIRETTARTLFNKAHALDIQNRKADAIEIYDEVIRRYGDDVDGTGRELSGRSLFTKAVLTAAMAREDDALRLYDRYLSKYGADAEQRPYAAEAMFNIGAAHGVKDRSKEAVEAYDRMLARFRNASEPAVTEFVAASLYNKSNRLSDLKQPAEAIKSYDELIATFGNDPRMPERIAKAMINRANQYGVMGKRKEANAGYEAVIDKFAGSSNAGVQQQVANARKWKS